MPPVETVKSESLSLPNTLPDCYTQLGVTSGWSPVLPKDMRLFLLSESGGGKTTFISNIPRTIILDFEKGSQEVIHGRGHRVWMRNYQVYKNIMNLLIRDGLAGKHHFDRVAFDTGDAWVVMVDRAMAEERSDPSGKVYETMGDYGSHGAGYSALYKRLLFDLDQIYKAGYTWAVTGHVAEKDITVGTGKSAETIVVKRPVMSRGIVSSLEAQSELTAFLEDRSGVRSTGTITKKLPNGQSVEVPTPGKMVREFVLRIEVEAHRHEGKRRIDGLAGVVVLSEDKGWDDFVAHWQKAIDNLKK